MNKDMDYLRISVTDRCNLRCMYCMPKNGIINRPQEELLSFEEIGRLVRILVSLGTNKIRLTGGEPLVRRGIVDLIKSLAGIEGIEDLSLTTNGILLSQYAEKLKEAGIKRINISLDTLKEDKFRQTTGNGSFCRVLEGICKAKEVGFHPLKLNMVVMKGVNEDEIIDFVEFALHHGLILRFIELIKATPLWGEDYFIAIEDIKKICAVRFSLKRIGNLGPGPAEYYRIEKDGLLGFIETHENNCRSCNRLRLTCTGELKICLYETQGLCLKSLLRKRIADEEIKDIIRARLELKRYIDYRDRETSQLYMCKVGG